MYMSPSKNTHSKLVVLGLRVGQYVEIKKKLKKKREIRRTLINEFFYKKRRISRILREQDCMLE